MQRRPIRDWRFVSLRKTFDFDKQWKNWQSERNRTRKSPHKLMNVCLEHENFDPPFLERIKTVDEMWVYEYDTSTIWRMDCQRRSNTPKTTANQVKSKSDVNCFLFGIRGLVHYDFLPQIQTLNETYFLASFQMSPWKNPLLWRKRNQN